jgi:hypothetical protein
MLRAYFIAVVTVLLVFSAQLRAQENEVSLGDLARATRKTRVNDTRPVIDNENLGVMMDKAESERLNGKPVFSIDPSGKSFRMTSPDGTCSLSFDANATALISTPFVSSELPQDQLLKLEGPAGIHDGVLEISLHNASDWEVKEIVIGVTVLQNPSAAALKPALFGPSTGTPERLPDLTMLYHLKATAPPEAVTTFRANLGDTLDSTKDWHWSLVSARGVPPAAPGSVETPAAISSPVQSFQETNNTAESGPSELGTPSYLNSAPSTRAPIPAPVNAPPPTPSR